MTNFEILKNSIWDAVKTDDKEAFDKNCEALMEKARNDIWRIGWSLRPKGINAVYEMLDDIAKWCHERWIEAMKCGDAPPEDVSPAEGIMLIKQVIYDAVKGSVIQGGCKNV